MKQSALFSTTKREAPAGEVSKNAILLERGGYVTKTMAGVYSFLPLGLRVLRKICDVIREEMDALPRTSEVQMTVLQPKEVWEETGRWDDEGMKEVMYRVGDDANVGLGATHEENITDIFRHMFSSHKELPLGAYQIQTKFRKEARAKSGLLRGREFLMKDLYSFHVSEEAHNQYYEEVAAAYTKIFTRLGMEAIRTEASGGVFSKQHSHEYQVICEVGEDDIYLNPSRDYAWNKEVITGEDDPKLLEFSGGEIRKASAVEVGNIFHLGTKFSTPMNASVTLENGERQPVYMGSYGIGPSRVMGVLVELFGTLGENNRGAKIIWPSGLAPVTYHILDLLGDGTAHNLYEQFKAAGLEVLLDDREGKTAGEKFADADLVGAPRRIVVSKRSMEAGGVEYRQWPAEETEIVALDQVISKVTA
ncbi:proline--tRNA ligase [soil metagenome]